MLLIGLTGGIASGKTLASDAFAAFGTPIIDADIIARKVVEPDTPGLIALIEHFGQSIVTQSGQLDRSVLRNIIFKEPAKRATVDGLLHPLIKSLADEHIETARAQKHPYAIYSIPLLVETRQQDRYDKIIVVDVPVELQIERLLERDGSEPSQAQSIVDAQATREQRLNIADFVIDNTGSIENTLKQVEEIHRTLLKLAIKNSN